ncbi:MAG: SAM-dependent methyltransferase [Methylacidiphilales bacterium]|nr:SAM-dependent methyltransferase [Candidatus Methylacidiphilales bacterium]
MKLQSFDQFMEQSLYCPNAGYYDREIPVMGHTGDFLTSPHLSPLVAQSLAYQFAHLYREDSSVSIVEFGGGTGKLAFDLLTTLQTLGIVTIRYFLVEKTNASILWQEKTLAPFLPQITWCKYHELDSIELPPNAMVVFHEVLDAFPAKRALRTDDGVLEQYMQESSPGIWTAIFAEASRELAEASQIKNGELLNAIPEGNEFELRINLAHTLNVLLRKITHAHLVIIDYGEPATFYYRQDRLYGTLKFFPPHYNLAKLPFGKCDISVDVNFSEVAEALQSIGYTIEMFLPQGMWLLEHCFSSKAPSVSHTNLFEQVKYRTSSVYLVSPSGMGDQFKVLIANKNISTPWLDRFARYDCSERL